MNASDQKESPFNHFYTLDALRGLAAFAIVVFHWQHFFNYEAQEQSKNLPLYSLFSGFYVDGQHAVDLFFCLSGFIFFWLYAEKIRHHQISSTQFFILRFSRLYPLHFLTLMVVAAEQKVMLSHYGKYFLFKENNFYHFFLQTFFAGSWGFERGISFNAPVWSVSIEILLYAVFFCICLKGFHRWWHMALLVICGFFIMSFNHGLLGRGIFSFFIGGLTFRTFSLISQINPGPFILSCFAGVTGLLWVVVPTEVHRFGLYHFFKKYLWSENLNFHSRDSTGFMLLKLSPLSFELLLFPLTIITLALWDKKCRRFFVPLKMLGDISYSSYLIHFPLQIILMAISIKLALPVSFFSSATVFFLFMVILVLFSLCSYHFFERPCQSMIRTHLLGTPARVIKPAFSTGC